MPLSSNISKTKNMSKRGKSSTPSFVCEIPLRVTRKQEKAIDARLEAGRQMYNALLGEAMRRMKPMKQSKSYQAARKFPKSSKKERASAFHTAKMESGFTEYQLSQYATELRKSWLGEHIGAHIAQTLTKRAFQAASKVAFGQAKKVRFKGKRGLHSLEGKNNETGLRWRTNHLEWEGLSLPMVKGLERDPVIQHGLQSRVKYVRLVRRNLNGQDRFYAQLICEGIPYHKPEHTVGHEEIGLDIGPSTIAIVGDTQADLKLFAEEVVRNHKKIRRLQRKQDRQRRANNPDCFDDKGRAIKGKKPKKKSRHQQKTEKKLAELHRLETAQRKTLHGQMANQVIAQGSIIKTEKLSYKAFQKLCGKSISVRAPKLFLSILTRKAESAGGKVEEFSTYHTALSQVCICGQRHKKRLSDRVHVCDCGVVAQRDLFSAYLAKHVENNRLQAADAYERWQGAEPLLRTAWQQASNQPASGRHTPTSFGIYRSQSGSSEKGKLAYV